MKKLLLLFAVLATAITASAKRLPIPVDGIYYDVNDEDFTATVINPSSRPEQSRPAYKGDIVIPSTFTYGKGDNAKTYTVTAIADKAFYRCQEVSSIQLPNTITEIGDQAFHGCSMLPKIELPSSLEKIGVEAFLMCGELTSVEIPNSVTEIGEGAFAFCLNLTSITGKFASDDHLLLITDGVLNAIATAAFPATYTLPNTITRIGEYVFYACFSLTSIEIPNSVTSIGAGAFGACIRLKSFSGKFASADQRCLIDNGKLYAFAPAGLTEYALPNSVTTIGERALFNLFEQKLRKFVLPSSLTTLEPGAIIESNSMDELISLNPVPPTGEMIQLPDFSYFVIKVPAESVEAYKTSMPWSRYSNKIVALTEEEITGIESLNASQNSKLNTQNLYYLSGQQVGEGVKGIVIQNGKKIIKR